jgi:hypothetical protein
MVSHIFFVMMLERIYLCTIVEINMVLKSQFLTKMRYFARRSCPIYRYILVLKTGLIHFTCFVQVGSLTVSADHQYLSYTMDITGDESYGAYVKDLNSGEDLCGDTLASAAAVEWARSDGMPVLYYTVPDEFRRPWRVYRHTLGTPTAGVFLDVRCCVHTIFWLSLILIILAEDELVLTEHDPSVFVGLAHTKDRRFVSITLNSKATSEVWLLDADFTAPAEAQVCGRGGWLMGYSKWGDEGDGVDRFYKDVWVIGVMGLTGVTG